MKTAITYCQHCKKQIGVNGSDDFDWNEMLRILLFRKDLHELAHFVSGDDIYSKMEREMRNEIRD